MLQTFVITLREGVEASLVIAIAISYLRKTGRLELLPTVYRALGIAVIACILTAWALSQISYSAEAFEGWTLLLSAAFVLSMVIWMNRHGKTMKTEIETRLQNDTGSSTSSWGVFAFVFLMIFREGVETVLLLAATRLNTSGIFEALGAVLGIGLAVLFGVSFIRGTIRVNLRQFFQMTTVILMVVVVQLAITGLHELSEGQILPSSRQEMALIGPVVKNDIFFFITILALSAAMILFESRKRRVPKADGIEGAALRKIKAAARREKLWMVASCTASCVFILFITAEFIYARQATALSVSEPVTLQNGAVRIPVNRVNDAMLHRYELEDGGVHVRFIVIEKPDRTLATAFDACAICGTQGFYQKGPELICRNCASAIVTSTVGTKGGCNPIPFQSHVEGDTLIIDAAALEGGLRMFAASRAN